MDTPRIAVLGTRGIPNIQGGVEKHCEELYPPLVSKGCKVRLYARKGYVESTPAFYKGVEILPLWAPRKKNLEAITHTLAGLIHVGLHRKEFDIVHIHAIGPSLLVPLARLLGLKVVVTNHGPDYDRQKWGKFAKSMLKLSEKIGAKFATSVIAVSHHIRESVFDKCGARAVYIPNGVEIPEKLAPGPFLQKYGLEKNRYILAVGRLVPEKGFHDLLEAYAGIDTSWKLAIAGDADHQDDYSRDLKAVAAGIPGVIMTGFIKGDPLRELYSNAGLFVLPSYHEGLPIAALEAMSYGVPTLLSDIPANMELARECETFPPKEPKRLAAAIESFLENPEAFFDEKTANARRERLQSEFNWDRISERTLNLYEEILSRPSA